MFARTRVFYVFFIFVLVTWGATAKNVTTKLKKINRFTSGRLGNLTTTTNTTAAVLPHSVTTVLPSCSRQCSKEIQQAVFKGKLKNTGRFQGFHTVCCRYSRTFNLSVLTSGVSQRS
jgi:hypothetical protein